MTAVFGPGSTLGILGGGQLGRMLALVARRLGYQVHVFDPDADAPARQVADVAVAAPFDDLDAAAQFARGVDVVTLEFENIPAATVEAAERFAPVRPGARALHVAQHRLREKTFLRDAGVPTARFASIVEQADIRPALEHTGLPAILKTAAFGYDGKGQRRVESLGEAEQAWRDLGRQPLVAEELVRFSREVSVVAVRGVDGQFASYGPIENRHRRHILDVSFCPATVSSETACEAIDIARHVVEQLDVIGVLCVEFFVTEAGRTLVNELAPRPHNSGHLTIDAHVTSQFEQQLRAVCGLPLGSTRQLRPAAMVNLLGELWTSGEPAWDRALAVHDSHLHLYGKRSARPGRKMGHVTALGKTTELAVRRARRARASLRLSATKNSAT